MKLRYFAIAAATGLTLAATAPSARADGYPVGPTSAGAVPAGYAPMGYASGPGCVGPGCGGGFGKKGWGKERSPAAPTTLFGDFTFHRQKLPVFQAAPWYNYWPYDAHFLMPAPISGPFYGPPMTGNFPVNPYFPGPAGAVGFGPGYGFGQGIPGGPPPVPALGGR